MMRFYDININEKLEFLLTFEFETRYIYCALKTFYSLRIINTDAMVTGYTNMTLCF